MKASGKAESIRSAFTNYIHVAALVFVLSGLAMLFATSGTDRQIRETEPLLELRNSTLLWVAGVFHLVVGGLLFAPLDLMRRNLIVLWAGSWHLIYLVGMLCMKAATPFPAVQLVGWKIGANNPRIVDVLWRFFILYLLGGSLAYLIVEWRRMKRLAQAAYLDEWKDKRESAASGVGLGAHKEKPAATPAAGKPLETALAKTPGLIEETRPSGFKFACPHCGQHIQCGGVYVGRQINCPACNKLLNVPGDSLIAGSPGLTGVGPGKTTSEGDFKASRPTGNDTCR